MVWPSLFTFSKQIQVVKYSDYFLERPPTGILEILNKGVCLPEITIF